MGEDCMPLTHSIATRLGKKLTDVRKSGDLWWLRPDGKTQVTIEYLQRADGSVEPQKIHTVVISTSRICTSTPLVSSSSVGRREMQASRAARSSSTPTAVGVPTVVALSLARTQLRWTGPLPTFAGRWPSWW